MADDTLPHPVPSTQVSPGMYAVDPAEPKLRSGVVPATPVTAADKLRAFEDKTFGKDCPRINGEVERGVGSPYSRMTVPQKAHYASLEHLVKCEKAVADASADLEAAKLKHDAAVKASDDASKAIETADKAA